MEDYKYIVEAKYANGDDYADKFDTLYEVIEDLEYIRDNDKVYIPKHERILSHTIRLYTENQETGELSISEVQR